MKKMNYNNKMIDMNEIDVLTTNEYWNSYTLVNGKVLKVKSVLVSIFEAVDEKDDNGEPIYMVNGNNIIKVIDKE